MSHAVPDAERARLADQRWKRWGRTWPSARGAPCARTTAPTATPGTTSRTTTPARRAYRWSEDGLRGICDDAAAPLLRARALERPRPDPQGAALRADRATRATTARTSRSTGATSTPRPTPLATCAGATSTRSALPLRRAGATRTRAAARDDPEYELLDTGVFDEDRYFDVDGRVRQGRRRRHAACAITRRQPRARRGDAAPAADALVPQHLVVGPRRAPDPPLSTPPDGA